MPIEKTFPLGRGKQKMPKKRANGSDVVVAGNCCAENCCGGGCG